MKKVTSIILAVAMVLAVFTALPFESATANETEIQIFVAPNGSDRNPGTQSRPFYSLERAKREIRSMGTLQKDVTVFLRGGEYFLSDTLWLGRVDSGTNGHTVTYRAYPGEQPTLNGGTKVTGWEAYQGNIYRAYVGVDKHFTALSENGERAELARTPNAGYNTLVNPPGQSGNSSKKVGYFTAGDIPAVADASNLQMFVWGGGVNGDIAWASDIIDVDSIDYAAHSVTLKSEAHYELGGGSRYFMRGAMEFLDSPGEFYMNNKDGYLYYYPKSLPIESQNIVMPLEKNLIEVRGDDLGKAAGNLSFVGLRFTNTDVGSHALYAKYVHDVTVDSCVINNVGGRGLYFHEQAEHCSVTNCHIYDVGASGIDFYGSGGGYYSKNNVISNNLLHNTGIYDGGGGAISLWETGDSVISHNTIYDTPRFSICISSPGEDSASTDYARNLTIEYNDMWNANTDSQDSGVFYTWCASGGGNVVRNNNIHDSNIEFSFGYGLYLDDKSDGWQVENNLIHDLQKNYNGAGHLSGSVMIKGIDPVIKNNIIANNDNRVIDDGGSMLQTTRTDAAFFLQELNPGLPTRNAHVLQNIVAYHTNPNIYRLSVPTTTTGLAESDYNLYYRTYTSTWSYDQYRFDGGNAHNPSDWATWIADYNGKYDQHSIVDQDPLFMDMANGDYRLRYDSPAYQIGFTDFNMEDMGVTASFPYGNKEGALRELYIRANSDSANRSFVPLGAGESEKLILSARTVDGLVANLKNASVAFTSDNPSVATVTSDGTVTALSNGTARITATVQKGGVTRTIAMDMLVGGGTIVESVSANGTQITGAPLADPVNTIDVSFAQSMNPSTLNSDNVKVYVNDVEVSGATLSASSNHLTVTLPTAVDYGQNARIVLSTAVKTASGTSLSYPISKGFSVGEQANEVPEPQDAEEETPELIYPTINYYSYLDFESEPLGKTPGTGGNAISGMQFYSWKDTTIAMDPTGENNQVLRIFKPYNTGDMSIDNTKMFDQNQAKNVTTFETKFLIDDLYTEWTLEALSAAWGKGQILRFLYQDLETSVHDPLKRPIPNVGYIEGSNGGTKVAHTEKPIFENTWYTLTVTIDMSRQKYSVYLDGESLFTDYTLPLSGTLRGLRFYNNMNGYRDDSTLYLDDYAVYEGAAQLPRAAGAGETPSPTATPKPTAVPTEVPTTAPTAVPTAVPTTAPTTAPGVTDAPTEVPTTAPTAVPTAVPTSVPTAAPTAVPTPQPTEDPHSGERYLLYEADTSAMGNNFDTNLGWQDMESRTRGTSINQSSPFTAFMADPLTDINTVYAIEKSAGTSVSASMPFCANSDWGVPNWSADDYRKGNTGACYEFKFKVSDFNTDWTLLSSGQYKCFTLTENGILSNSDSRLTPYPFETNTWYRVVLVMTGYNGYNLYIDAPGTENDRMIEGLGGINNENRIHGSNVIRMDMVSGEENANSTLYIDDVCAYKNRWDTNVAAFITRENPSLVVENPNFYEEPYEILHVDFLDGETPVDSIDGLDSLTGAVTVAANEDFNAVLIVAVYDSDRMIDLAWESVSVPAGDVQTVTGDVSLTGGGCCVKVMLWNNLLDMMPLMEAEMMN